MFLAGNRMTRFKAVLKIQLNGGCSSNQISREPETELNLHNVVWFSASTKIDFNFYTLTKHDTVKPLSKNGTNTTKIRYLRWVEFL